MTEKKKTTEADNDSVAEEGTQAELSAARERFGEVISGVEKRARGLKDGAGRTKQKVKERAEQASTVAREKYDVARESARQGYDKVTKDMDQLGHDVGEYVQHNPGKSVAIALGVGFLLGILLRPRRE